MCQWTGWVIIGPGNGLSPVRQQAITRTTAGLLSIGTLGIYFNAIWIRIQLFSFKKMQLKMSSAKMAAVLHKGRRVKGARVEFTGRSFVLKITLSLYSFNHEASDFQVLPNCVLTFSKYGLCSGHSLKGGWDGTGISNVYLTYKNAEIRIFPLKQSI